MNFVQGGQENGLTYSNVAIGDLVNKDTDGDGVLDWEESLYGLDPTKKETTPGTSDQVVANKLKFEQESNSDQANGGDNSTPENLTETDKFSRELFSTTAALNQNGAMDQATADKISSSLADRIKNTPVRKIYVLSDIKISNDESVAAVQNYAIGLETFYKTPQTDYSVMDVLQQFILDENNVDVTVLIKLDPIIKQTSEMIDRIAGINVPESLAPLHLNLLNAMEKVLENINDIKLYDTDSIVALSGISQYQNNVALIQSALQNLANALDQKLNY